MANSNDANYISASSPDPKPGPFLARVVSNIDPTYMGMLEVEILNPVGGSTSEGQLHQVKYMSPFWGQTSVDHVGEDPNDYNQTQKSYGMWMVPPDVGATVIIIFIDGDPRKGYWIGCVPDENMNFMVPGIAATENVVEGGGRIPVAEYNKKINEGPTDPTRFKKPRHPLADVLENQGDKSKGGLLKDDIRGTTTSSARREAPSSVFGISTPGPLDKQSNSKTGSIGKLEHKIPNAPVSRLGGTTFVMDDGDDKFLRKMPAHQGPPEYVAVEQGEKGGNVTIPHNECVRIRTRTGHQILMHNSEDLIYIGNARGTTWIELTSLGKIDIYAKDSISIHTENDFNVTADRDINFTAKRNVNINAGNSIFATATTNYEIKAGADGKLTAGGSTNIKSGGNHIETASNIHMNGPAASPATAALKANRIPLMEPWEGHENLDPLFSLADSTEAKATPAQRKPAMFQKNTTTTDTFNKVKGAE